MASVILINRTGILTVQVDGVEYNFTKRNVKLRQNGDYVRISDYNSLVVEVAYQDVTTPTVSSGTNLLNTISAWLQ